jgi:protein TonB
MPFALFGQSSADSISIKDKVNSERGNASVSAPSEPIRVTKEDGICKNPDEEATFNGGNIALAKYLKKNVYYPLDVPDNVEGKVYVSFVIEKDGSVTNVKIVKSAHPSFSVEAIRVIKRMPKWIPGKKNGEIVRTKIVLPFVFSIHDFD